MKNLNENQKKLREKILSNETNINDSVLALITSYNPGNELAKLIQFLNDDDAVSSIVIYDNSSCKGMDALDSIERNFCKVVVIKSSKNNGIGMAYNESIIQCWNGEKFIITFDQDSIIEKNFVKREKEKLKACNSKDQKIVSIGPRIISIDSLIEKHKQGKVVRRPLLITSGNLFYADAFAKIGGFNESYFIDCVDYELCCRFRNKGYKLVQDRGEILYQNIGTTDEGERFHSNLRMYYMIRNHKRMTKEYFVKFPLYITIENILFARYKNKWKKRIGKQKANKIIKKAKEDA